MAKRSGKSVSFDAMIKFFMIRFEIPTRQDIQKIVTRLDQLEKTIKKNAFCGKSKRSGSSKVGGGNARMSASGQTSNASDVILKAIKGSAQGLDYAGIFEITQFDEKKIRNILHRLHKTGKIQRKQRGLYIAG
ncbi:MAG: hypothetical protein Q7U40_13775 [Desulfatirhabdiaceae bacterium]|nr:hypothetical protein [Desulfatirhabdiaceae bacterium]